MRILIIGGTGFIGPKVVRRLKELEHEVALFHRGFTKFNSPPGVKHIFGDRRHLLEYKKEFARFAPDIVLDMFPFSEEDAHILIRTFRGITNRLIAISSQDVYRAYGKLLYKEPGPLEPLPIREDAPLRSKLYLYRDRERKYSVKSNQWMDNYEKILVERILIENQDPPSTILRLPIIYGPGDKQHRLFEYLKRMDDNRPFILVDKNGAKWRCTRGYVENIAEAIILTITNENSLGRIYNVGESKALSLEEWIRNIGKIAGWKGEIIMAPEEILPQHLRANFNTKQHLICDTTRIRIELGYKELVSQDEALRRTIFWERAHPPEMVDLKKFDYSLEDAIVSKLKGKI